MIPKNTPQTSRYGEFLTSVRLANRMSMAEVMRESQLNSDASTGVSAAVLSRIESGRVLNPQFSTMVKVARGYGVSLEELARFFD